MHKIAVTFIVILFWKVTLAQIKQKIVYKGFISNYGIIMELNVQEEVNGTCIGRYKYSSKQKWLVLKGKVVGPTGTHFLLTEYDASGKATGNFDLNADYKSLDGKWENIQKTKTFKVSLLLKYDDESDMRT